MYLSYVKNIKDDVSVVKIIGWIRANGCVAGQATVLR